MTTLWQLAHLIGLMTSTSSTVLPAPINYRMLQMLHSQALSNIQSYDIPIPWTQEAHQDLEWQVDQMSSYNWQQIVPKQTEVYLESDASKKGGGHTAEPQRKRQEDCGASRTSKLISIFWVSRQLFLLFITSENQKKYSHANVSGQHSDSTIHQLYGRHMLSALCHLAIELWKWWLVRKITLYAELPGSLNFRADFELRHHSNSTDWRLHLPEHPPRALLQLEIRPSSSRGECLVRNMEQTTSICFPYCLIIGRCLQKVWKLDYLLLIAPIWPAQSWYPLLLKRLVEIPRVLPQQSDIFLNSEGAMSISGAKPSHSSCLASVSNFLKTSGLQKMLKEYTVPPGEKAWQNHMNQYRKMLQLMLCNEIILFKPLFTPSQNTWQVSSMKAESIAP